MRNTHDIMRGVSNTAPALLPLFRSELQARILAYLLLDDDEIGISELARALHAQQPTVHREVARLVDADILTDRTLGRTRLVTANRANPAYRALRELLEVVYGPAVLLRGALAEIPGIQQAFIYGSWAARYAGEPGQAPADIDLMIIGKPDPDRLHVAVSSAETQLRREVNFVVIDSETWAARTDDPFLSDVAAGPTVPVGGDDR